MRLEDLMEEATHSIATHVACLKKTPNVLVICGSHNMGFAESLIRECYAEHAFPHLWVWNEKLFKKKGRIVTEDAPVVLPKHTSSLLEGSDLVVWLTQFEDPANAEADLGMTVCSFWDRVEETIKGKPLILINLYSSESTRRMDIRYERYLAAFASATNVDYERMKRTGLAIHHSLTRRRLINVTDPNGTNISFSIEGRRVGIENGTLDECLATGRECEVEIPAGEVYVAPLESSASGRLVVDQVRDLDVRRLDIKFEHGTIAGLKAEKGEARFRSLLDHAEGSGSTFAELGIGINHEAKPIGLRLYDEKALGTVHVAIGNNIHLGGANEASIHFDFNLYRPSLEADSDLIIKDGRLVARRSGP